MIRYVYADELNHEPALKQSMFRDRAAQFRDRLNWDVSVDEKGWEVDQYDHLNPLYTIWQNPDGQHGGSMRILPTVGQTMTTELFLHITGGVRIVSPLIWECTRFCVSPRSFANVGPAVMLAGMEFGLRFGVEQAIGVVYAHTLPLYRRLGWMPDIVGQERAGVDEICICLWEVSEASIAIACRKAEIPQQ